MLTRHEKPARRLATGSPLGARVAALQVELESMRSANHAWLRAGEVGLRALGWDAGRIDTVRIAAQHAPPDASLPFSRMVLYGCQGNLRALRRRLQPSRKVFGNGA